MVGRASETNKTTSVEKPVELHEAKEVQQSTAIGRTFTWIREELNSLLKRIVHFFWTPQTSERELKGDDSPFLEQIERAEKRQSILPPDAIRLRGLSEVARQKDAAPVAKVYSTRRPERPDKVVPYSTARPARSDKMASTVREARQLPLTPQQQLEQLENRWSQAIHDKENRYNQLQQQFEQERVELYVKGTYEQDGLSLDAPEGLVSFAVPYELGMAAFSNVDVQRLINDVKNREEQLLILANEAGIANLEFKVAKLDDVTLIQNGSPEKSAHIQKACRKEAQERIGFLQERVEILSKMVGTESEKLETKDRIFELRHAFGL